MLTDSANQAAITRTAGGTGESFGQGRLLVVMSTIPTRLLALYWADMATLAGDDKQLKSASTQSG